MRNLKYKDLRYLIYRMQLTYNEIIDILDLEYIPTKRIGFPLNPNIYNVVGLNKSLTYILRDNVKINVFID